MNRCKICDSTGPAKLFLPQEPDVCRECDRQTNVVRFDYAMKDLTQFKEENVVKGSSYFQEKYFSKKKQALDDKKGTEALET